MASIAAVQAAPTTVTPGGTSNIVPVIDDPDGIATVTVSVDGSSGSVNIALHEPLIFTTDQTKIGVKGYVVGTLIAGAGTLVVGPSGVAFAFTSA